MVYNIEKVMLIHGGMTMMTSISYGYGFEIGEKEHFESNIHDEKLGIFWDNITKHRYYRESKFFESGGLAIEDAPKITYRDFFEWMGTQLDVAVVKKRTINDRMKEFLYIIHQDSFETDDSIELGTTTIDSKFTGDNISKWNDDIIEGCEKVGLPCHESKVFITTWDKER